MGTYATAALVLSLLFFIWMRKDMKLYTEKQGMSMSLKPTNFHQEVSDARPLHEKYYSRYFDNIYE